MLKLQNLKIQRNGYHGFKIEMEDRLDFKTIYKIAFMVPYGPLDLTLG